MAIYKIVLSAIFVGSWLLKASVFWLRGWLVRCWSESAVKYRRWLLVWWFYSFLIFNHTWATDHQPERLLNTILFNLCEWKTSDPPIFCAIIAPWTGNARSLTMICAVAPSHDHQVDPSGMVGYSWLWLTMINQYQSYHLSETPHQVPANGIL